MWLLKTKPEVERISVEDDFFTKIAEMRYRVYCEELGFLDKENFSTKKETDSYDKFSVHILVRVGRRIGGYARVILPNNMGLPVFEHFNVPEEKNMEHSCELSRFIISKAYRYKRETRREIFRLLAEEILSIVEENKIRVVYAVVEEWLFKSLVKRGYSFQQIGEGRYHMGAVTFPVRLNLDEMKPNDLPNKPS